MLAWDGSDAVFMEQTLENISEAGVVGIQDVVSRLAVAVNPTTEHMVELGHRDPVLTDAVRCLMAHPWRAAAVQRVDAQGKPVTSFFTQAGKAGNMLSLYSSQANFERLRTEIAKQGMNLQVQPRSFCQVLMTDLPIMSIAQLRQRNLPESYAVRTLCLDPTTVPVTSDSDPRELGTAEFSEVWFPVLQNFCASWAMAGAVAQAAKVSPAKPKYQKVFGDWLCDMAEKDQRLVGITPAMCEGSGMNDFAERFPDRYEDVAIAEQHAVTLAAGMACEGAKPVVAIYSTFLQRGYDQLIHDVALQNLGVLFAIDRAGLVGEDGPTHAGSFDISYLRCIPNMVVMTPSDEAETRLMLSTGYQHKGPAAVRYPRGKGPGAALSGSLDTLVIGKGIIRRKGENVALLAFGSLTAAALTAAETLDATVADMRFVKPLDAELIAELASTHGLLVTVEENAIMGGAGSAVCEHLAATNCKTSILNLGLSDTFIEHGKVPQMLAGEGLDAEGIVRAIRARLAG